MIRITYKNKQKEARELIYTENLLDEMWNDIKKILDDWSEILWVYKITN